MPYEAPSAPSRLPRGLLAAFAAVASAAAALAGAPPADAISILDGPVFFLRIQDDSDVVVRCGAGGTVEVAVDGAPAGPLQTPCSSVTYVEVNASGDSGSNLLDLSAVTREAFSSLREFNPILIEGGDGDDTILGSPLPDTITAQNGDDYVDAGPGDDVVMGGAGQDAVACGEGADLLTYISDQTGVAVDLTGSAPFTGGEAEGDTATGCEHLRGGPGDDRLTGVPGPYEVDGAGGDDIITGLPGNRLAGGPGEDTVSFVRHGAGVRVDLARQTASGGGDPLTLTGFEAVLGSRFADRLLGDGGPNALDGGAGNDWIDGRDGDDRLRGGRGADRVLGGAGDDLLLGGAGNDRIQGGPGRDTCRGGAGRNRLRSC